MLISKALIGNNFVVVCIWQKSIRRLIVGLSYFVLALDCFVLGFVYGQLSKLYGYDRLFLRCPVGIIGTNHPFQLLGFSSWRFYEGSFQSTNYMSPML